MKLMLRQSCCLLLKVCPLSNVSATNDLESLVFLTIKHKIDNVLVHPFLAWPYHLGLACMVLMSKGKNSMLLLAFDTTIQPKIRWLMHKLGLEVIGGLVAFRSPGSSQPPVCGENVIFLYFYERQIGTLPKEAEDQGHIWDFDWADLGLLPSHLSGLM